MNIQSLLNSPESASRWSRKEVAACPPPPARHRRAGSVAPKKQKLAKDAPVFTEGTKIVGHINYPPHEAYGDQGLEAKHHEFCVFPLGEIFKKGLRHIPYASDKKDFLEKTNRESFEVFQYTYKTPGEEKPYTVVWDYNVGLVRMTPFFKSCKYAKTVPSKALNQNTGLRDISYSITGGALVCQGYWVPWQAARELAATFCWDIRWALTPVFGNDFPQICTTPQDPSFGKFVIKPDTVRFCKTETDRFRDERFSYQLLLPKASPQIVTSQTPTFTLPAWKPDNQASPLESGYGTDVDQHKTGSSDIIYPPYQYGTTHLTSIDGVKSPSIPNIVRPSIPRPPIARFALTPMPISTSPPETPYSECLRTKRTHSKIADDGSGSVVVRADIPSDERQGSIGSTSRHSSPSLSTSEAAKILLSIGVVARDATTLPEPKRSRRGFMG